MKFSALTGLEERLKAVQKADSSDSDNSTDPAAKLFTKAYGDCFISGGCPSLLLTSGPSWRGVDFVEGGELSAVISIKVADESKITAVSLAASASLAVGPSPLSVGGGAKFDKSHEAVLADTEISISVNWVGGGEIKKRKSRLGCRESGDSCWLFLLADVQWTLPNLVLIANAFPSLVARNYTKTSW
jgi:hypothetical protein